MVNDFSFLAIIPAREGSKGLPGKNILDFSGKPLISWSISNAINTNLFDSVIVSTDSKEIADISEKAGATVPFLRPPELSNDNASIIEVANHAWLNHLDSNNKPFDFVVLLQPTSPLRTSEDITKSVNLYLNNRKSNQDTLVSVTEIEKKYGWLMKTTKDSQYIDFIFDVNINNPQRQSLENIFLPNGAIFITNGKNIINGFYNKFSIPYLMENQYSIDIDSISDFKLAESIFLKIH